MRRIVCVVIACLCLLLSNVAQSTSVEIIDTSMYQGQFMDSTLLIDGLGGPGVSPHLGAFDLDISFDSNIITLYSVTFQNFTFQNQSFESGLGDPDFRSFTRSGLTLVPSQPGQGEAIASATLLDRGSVNLLELSLLPENDPVLDRQRSPLILAQLRFGGLRLGSSPLDITINGLSNESGFSLPTSVVNGNVSVINVVPEIDASSGTIAIGLLLGILALLGERRKCPQPDTVG